MEDRQTMHYNFANIAQNKNREILDLVYSALKEKGYNPISQLVGYVMSGDPTYITSYNNARALVTKLERDELLEEVFRYYLEKRNG